MSPDDVSTLAAAAAALSDAKARLAQAELSFEDGSGPEKAEYWMDIKYWTLQVEAAQAAWQALTDANGAEPA